MTAKPVARRPLGFWVLWLVILVTAALAGFLISTSIKIVREAGHQDLRRADAIVVFGAAEYSGRPSPVYRARLDHAYELFLRGLSPVVITTGGAGADPKFSEGGVGHDYLMHLARYCNIKGLTPKATLNGCLRYAQPDFDEKEISKIVSHIYATQTDGIIQESDLRE